MFCFKKTFLDVIIR